MQTTGKVLELKDLYTFDIFARVQGKWRRLIAQFRLPHHTIAALQSLAPKEACREVFIRWLDGGAEVRYPKTWATVITVLRNIGNTTLADEVRATLTKQHQPLLLVSVSFIPGLLSSFQQIAVVLEAAVAELSRDSLECKETVRNVSGVDRGGVIGAADPPIFTWHLQHRQLTRTHV